MCSAEKAPGQRQISEPGIAGFRAEAVTGIIIRNEHCMPSSYLFDIRNRVQPETNLHRVKTSINRII
jgi:hypothetical protein